MLLSKLGAVPICCFRATSGTCSFKRWADVDRENTMLGPRQTQTHTHTLHLYTTGCYTHIINLKAYKDSTWAILSCTNDARHSWRQSNNVPARLQTFRHLKLCTDEICKANVTSPAAFFPRQAFTVDENKEARNTSSGWYTALRESVFKSPQIIKELSSVLHNSPGTVQ